MKSNFFVVPMLHTAKGPQNPMVSEPSYESI